jgi:thiamine biosynthesis protein ThiS
MHSASITINGEQREVPAGLDIRELLLHVGLQPEVSLVEYNGEALLRREWPDRHIGGGDVLEVVRVVAGG